MDLLIEILRNSITVIVAVIGNNQQIKMAKEISKQLQDNGVTDIQPLITNLRDSLREELRLEKTNEKIVHLRFRKVK
ncbi:hypothetical protein [Paenibacillus sp. WLX2291]|uniref:hypothetical protein n=1 Tax=Paenibacillus sp. WLX2291 TaxID=3296934 RepID=UPI0039845677